MKGDLVSWSRRNWLRRCAALVVAGAVIPEALATRDAMGTKELEKERRLRFAITFSNPMSRVLTKQKFWMYMPVRETATQRLLDLQVSTNHQMHEDSFGHALLEIPFDDFPPLAQKVVTISLLLKVSAKSRSVSLSGNWLSAERYIESDDPRIKALAGELRRRNEWETARAIYDWVAGNLSYAGYLADDYGALYALIERKGDCTEYAYMLVALARACGIPARMAGGYVVDRDTMPRAEDYHNWAELHVDGSWHLMDAQKKNWLAPAEQYIAFRYYRADAHNQLESAHRFRMDGELNIRI
ncbi:MAG: hypothetical protein H6R18_477 [Proteobacteria bacterium]|nr:hypothetical protein [Pseudomonadota bacterium]